MATKLNIDPKLVEEAVRVGRHKTPREAVHAALDAYIKQKRRPAILDMVGTIDFDPDYDHKQLRRGKRE